MKKKILMICNTAEGLPGVPVDIFAYYSFFTGPTGGYWYHDEIDIMRNPTKRDLLKRIDDVRQAGFDYVITIYAGYGEEAENCPTLIINEHEESIEIGHWMNLSQRQVIIVDCCREFRPTSSDTSFIKAGATILSMSRDRLRRAYEDRIQASSPQEIILYACDEGEEAKDYLSYSLFLQRATQLALVRSNSQFVSVVQAHTKAVSLMQATSNTQQHPQILQSRCSLHRRLPWAINLCFGGCD